MRRLLFYALIIMLFLAFVAPKLGKLLDELKVLLWARIDSMTEQLKEVENITKERWDEDYTDFPDNGIDMVT